MAESSFRRRLLSQQKKSSNNYLTVVALDDDFEVWWGRDDFEYCIDNDENWLQVSTTYQHIPVSKGHSVSFRANIVDTASSYGLGTILSNGKFSLEGNCMSILYGDSAAENDVVPDYAFRSLFENTSVVSVSADFLPAKTINQQGYSRMFYSCSALTTAPELPATTLASNCYESMFEYCMALTTAPELPATTLATCCYSYMFSLCSALTTAPELPATTLASNCYESMFLQCASLTTAPELPATTLADYCYQRMFYGCTKLNYIKMLATDISATNCLNNWVNSVANTGTFIKHPDMNSLPTGTSGIPTGWTVQDV